MADPPSAPSAAIAARIAEECKIAVGSVRATVRLLSEGATVPFVAR